MKDLTQSAGHQLANTRAADASNPNINILRAVIPSTRLSSAPFLIYRISLNAHVWNGVYIINSDCVHCPSCQSSNTTPTIARMVPTSPSIRYKTSPPRSPMRTISVSLPAPQTISNTRNKYNTTKETKNKPQAIDINTTANGIDVSAVGGAVSQ